MTCWSCQCFNNNSFERQMLLAYPSAGKWDLLPGQPLSRVPITHLFDHLLQWVLYDWLKFLWMFTGRVVQQWAQQENERIWSSWIPFSILFVKSCHPSLRSHNDNGEWKEVPYMGGIMVGRPCPRGRTCGMLQYYLSLRSCNLGKGS